MQRRTRNQVCIWLIVGGLVNFLVYTVVYAELGGDARNGGSEVVVSDSGESHTVYYIRGHFMHSPAGKRTNVPRWMWIYSYLHSVSIWPTQAIMMVSMLILARPHIIATMPEGSWIRGNTFVAIAITTIVLIYAALTLWFIIGFVIELGG